ncbi:MAG: GAF domain-containing protein, partial [Deltaproteobacteria bacterium]|nr:GAF domain-containing protein [Deltaproteobacteria bacterium]
MLTGHANLDTAVECLRAGAFDFVQKPFQAGDLATVVDRAIERRQLRVTALLHDACSAVFGAGDRDLLPHLITEVASRMMAADDASLMLVDSHGGLYVSHTKKLTPAMQVEANAKAGSGVAAKVAQGRKPVIINGNAAEDERFSGVQGQTRARSCIVYPLYLGDRLLGVLNINRNQSKRPFRAMDIERATILASQIVLALENKRLTRTLVANEKLTAIGQLAAGITHEVNNPVAYVLANVGFVQDNLKKLAAFGETLATVDNAVLQARWQELGGQATLAEVRTAVDDIAKGANRIREIAGDMRTLATSDRGADTTFDVNDAIRSAVRITGAVVRRVAELKQELGEQCSVNGNPGQLSQVLVNLIVNAADAIEQAKSKEAIIHITSARDKADVVVEVSDNGCGIAPHDLRRIFEAFF